MLPHLLSELLAQIGERETLKSGEAPYQFEYG